MVAEPAAQPELSTLERRAPLQEGNRRHQRPLSSGTLRRTVFSFYSGSHLGATTLIKACRSVPPAVAGGYRCGYDPPATAGGTDMRRIQVRTAIVFSFQKEANCFSLKT